MDGHEILPLMAAWCGMLLAVLMLSAGCGSAGQYAAAQAAWEARDAQGAPGCPPPRRSGGTCIRDGP